MLHAAILLATLLTWHAPPPGYHGTAIAETDDHFTCEVEYVTWEGAPFWAWSTAHDGEVFAMGETDTPEEATHAAELALVRHRARTGAPSAFEAELATCAKALLKVKP